MNAESTVKKAWSCLAMASLLALAGQAGAQSRVEGRVFLLEDDEQRPTGGAWVRARVESKIVATAPTAPDGGYVLDGLPAGRVELDAVQPGCYTLEAAGVRARMAVKNCPPSGSCGEADFVVVRGAVIEGRVTDFGGDPLSAVAVSLTTADGRQPPPVGDAIARYRGETDDQGEFRLFGLVPDRYELTFHHGFGWEPLPLLFTEPQEVEIRFRLVDGS